MKPSLINRMEMLDSISIEQITLRLASRDDKAFLFDLYYDHRKDEFKSLEWTEEALMELIKIQFFAQDRQYGQDFPSAQLFIVAYGDLPIGKFQVDRSGEQIHLIDICLSKSYRANGIGSKLIQDLMKEASEVEKKISLQVMKSNPAFELYRRLGFQQVDISGTFVHLVN